MRYKGIVNGHEVKNLYFKVLYRHREPLIGYTDWPKVGIWTKRVEPYLCLSGWHVWKNGSDITIYNGIGPFSIYLAEIRGKRESDECKVAAEQARLVYFIGQYHGQIKPPSYNYYSYTDPRLFKQWLGSRINLK